MASTAIIVQFKPYIIHTNGSETFLAICAMSQPGSKGGELSGHVGRDTTKNKPYFVIKTLQQCWPVSGLGCLFSRARRSMVC